MSNADRQAVKAFLQAFIGTLIGSGILSAFGTAGVVKWSDIEKAGISAVAAGIIAALSFIQSALGASPQVAQLAMALRLKKPQPVTTSAKRSRATSSSRARSPRTRRPTTSRRR